MNQYRVRTLMRTDIATLSPETPIRRAAAVLVDGKTPAAPVLGDDGELIGILTQKDCFRSAVHASYHHEWTGKVADHMSRTVITINGGDELIRAAEMFLDHPHRVFPVVDDSRVVGLLHRSHVLTLLVRIGG
ncbi:CBS domain-containing protein [Primorskyibacter aestuariivivens]|uniref:CBS domain-containing protein n=1 Tax=Primorskyibacter aestuariivivens TaxID=1888912 RepID=UPI0023015B94|nr:CBS domain-containing protein [Primorskyibacter aestuariivivens]MDA7430960.1 CBS domain-containing protein [Primorskyibacter aestuariivivens]